MCRDEWRFNKCPRINEDLTFTKLFKDRALYIIRIWINLSLDLTGGVLGYSFHLSQAKFIHSPFGIRSLMRIIWNHCIVGPLIINLSNLSIIADCQQALIIDHNVLSAIIKWTNGKLVFSFPLLHVVFWAMIMSLIRKTVCGWHGSWRWRGVGAEIVQSHPSRASESPLLNTVTMHSSNDQWWWSSCHHHHHDLISWMQFL